MKKNGLRTCAQCHKPLSGTTRTFEVQHAAGVILIVVCSSCLIAGAPGYSIDAVASKVIAMLDVSKVKGFALDFAPGATLVRNTGSVEDLAMKGGA